MIRRDETTLPRTKKPLVVKSETIRALQLGNAAVRNLEELSRKDCPHPNADVHRDAGD